MSQHTKDKLGDELMKLGLMDMSLKARGGYYDDFLSPLDDPIGALVGELQNEATKQAIPNRDAIMDLRRRAINGDFDATREESDAWAASQEGQNAFKLLAEGKVLRDNRIKPGPTGEFPKGKMSPDDHGALVLSVTHDPDNGRVMVDFGTMTRWIALEQEQALRFAELIAKHAGVTKVEYTIGEKKNAD